MAGVNGEKELWCPLMGSPCLLDECAVYDTNTELCAFVAIARVIPSHGGE